MASDIVYHLISRLELICRLEHFSWDVTCANDLLKQWCHELALAVHLCMSFPCRLNQSKDNLLNFLLDLLFQHSYCVTKKKFSCKHQRIGAGWTSQRNLASFIWDQLSVPWPLTLALLYSENWIIICMDDWTCYHGQMWLPLSWTCHTSTCPVYLHEENKEYSAISKFILPLGRCHFLKQNFCMRLSSTFYKEDNEFLNYYK